MTQKTFEIIIYGATSFVGQIVCQYLCKQRHQPTLRWAMAGRSLEKLQTLQQSLGDAAKDVPLLVADSFDEAALTSLCQQTQVIISTVGPYALYGETLVRVCAQSGTDYCDLTGEPQWIKRMLDKYQSTAQQSGARIVPCCGFDCIPSDMGAYFLQQLAMEKFGSYCDKVKMRVKVLKGSASGGTIASMVNLFKEASADKALRKELTDPYSLCPPDSINRVTQRNVGVEMDGDFGIWTGPFIMAAINTRIVLRSNALRSVPYAPNFYYDEAMLTSEGNRGKKRAKRIARGSKLTALVMLLPPLRWLALKFFLPKPGEGPTPGQQRDGHYDLRFIGSTAKGDKLHVKVTGDRDPGYGSTAKMLAEAGICLARDIDKNSVKGGFWTPATAMQSALVARLQQFAGLNFQELDLPVLNSPDSK